MARLTVGGNVPGGRRGGVTGTKKAKPGPNPSLSMMQSQRSGTSLNRRRPSGMRGG
jgi:hypothetical protein